MASDKEFVDFIVEQIKGNGMITYKKMFGEYAIYSDGKIVALVCDNRFFVKQTEGGRRFIGKVIEDSPYPGAKPSFLIEDKLENRDWLSELIKITAQELPEPKQKKEKAR